MKERSTAVVVFYDQVQILPGPAHWSEYTRPVHEHTRRRVDFALLAVNDFTVLLDRLILCNLTLSHACVNLFTLSSSFPTTIL
jgi:hypothetical protein